MIDEFLKWLNKGPHIFEKKWENEKDGAWFKAGFQEAIKMCYDRYIKIVSKPQWEPKVGDFVKLKEKNPLGEEIFFVYCYIPRYVSYKYTGESGSYYGLIDKNGHVSNLFRLANYKDDFNSYGIEKTDKTFPLDGILELAELPKKCEHDFMHRVCLDLFSPSCRYSFEECSKCGERKGGQPI